MLIIVPNPIWVVWVTVIIIIFFFKFPKTKWIRKRKNGIKVLAGCTLILLPIVLVSEYDLRAYNSGTISMFGFSIFDKHVLLDPGKSYCSPTLSNWYTVATLYVGINVNSTAVTFYIRDENKQNLTYQEGNYTNAKLRFHLPYRYSDTFVVARWTINLYNPHETERIIVRLNISAGGFEDSGMLPIFYVYYYYLMPHLVLATIWISAGIASAFLSVTKKNSKYIEIDEK
jgi:hypothetical protein